MDITFDDGVILLKQYWKDNGRTINPGKTAALNSLRRHLHENDIPYSHEEALKWLSDNQAYWEKQKFFTNRRAVFELNDIMTVGKIIGEYKYYDDPFDALSDYWKNKVTEYMICHPKPTILRSCECMFGSESRFATV